MTEHEKLKHICDEIGYSTEYVYGDNNQYKTDLLKITSTRDIIFTEEFMDKFEAYMEELEGPLGWINQIIKYLDTPVEYLYNLFGYDLTVHT